eukprot:1410-Heterococcus_DN1.PRE.5
MQLAVTFMFLHCKHGADVSSHLYAAKRHYASALQQVLLIRMGLWGGCVRQQSSQKIRMQASVISSIQSCAVEADDTSGVHLTDTRLFPVAYSL